MSTADPLCIADWTQHSRQAAQPLHGTCLGSIHFSDKQLIIRSRTISDPVVVVAPREWLLLSYLLSPQLDHWFIRVYRSAIRWSHKSKLMSPCILHSPGRTIPPNDDDDDTWKGLSEDLESVCCRCYFAPRWLGGEWTPCCCLVSRQPSRR